jgi:hypothetical protein
MTTSIAVPKPPYSIGLVPLLAALLTVFALGGASGYLVHAPAASGVAAPRSVSACPAGMHAEVWYTAHSWACVAGQSS